MRQLIVGENRIDWAHLDARVACLAVGVIALVASMFVRGATAESVRALKEDFDRDLSLWESDPFVHQIKEHFERKEPDAPEQTRLWPRCRRYFNL